ncbi:MAG: putative zinc-binding metallopeptidase [Steroidobacteraceae bacterium]
MITFHCSSCAAAVYFENLQCLNCGSALGYVPADATMRAFDPAAPDAWHGCAHRDDGIGCNWLVAAAGKQTLCDCCRYTRTFPPLEGDNIRAWAKLEAAKRRLFYALHRLRLPIPDRLALPEDGLAFDFLSAEASAEAIMTGHASGIVTVSLAEADDVAREQARVAFHEPYRTLLGHLRHEIGHFYWERLLARTRLLPAFRAIFGDERQDYGAALERYYASSDDGAWRGTHISRYATSHPWEDWAECWSHYLHISDAMETAADAAVVLRNAGRRIGVRPLIQQRSAARLRSQLIAEWLPLAQFLNSACRSLGEPDSYPFVLPDPVIDKLTFIHRIVCGAARRAA